MRETLKRVLAEYGAIAMVVYVAIFLLVLLSAWAGINLGWRPTSVTANMGSFTAAYIATKLTQPVRIATTLAITPFVASVYGRVAGRLSR